MPTKVGFTVVSYSEWSPSAAGYSNQITKSLWQATGHDNLNRITFIKPDDKPVWPKVCELYLFAGIWKGEDERYRAADLNQHGPTVKGWRSGQHCNYPQDITIQLHTPALVNKIQILVHQYLIPHKIEILVCDDDEYDPSISPSGLQSFQYLGFITLSDNQATGFKSRELKSVTTPPTPTRFVKLRLYENHPNERNAYNQVGLVAVSVLGEAIAFNNACGDQINNNDQTINSDADLIANPQYTSPYDDLAFEMYVDRDVARIMRLMEKKKHQAVLGERFEYAKKLKNALDDLRIAGETLGRYDQEKRQAINMEDYDKAKMKKIQIDKFRDEVYTGLCIEQLLELDGQYEENDISSSCPLDNEGRKDSSRVRECRDWRDDEDPPPGPDSPPNPHYSGLGTSRVTWSPRHPARQATTTYTPYRKASLTDYPDSRSSAPSPNPLSHSFSHTSFPTSNSITQLGQTETPHFQCYTPYVCQPNLNVSLQHQPSSLQSLPPIRLHDPFYLPSETQSKSPTEASKERNHKSQLVECHSPPIDNYEHRSRANSLRAPSRQRSKSTVTAPAPTPVTHTSFEAYEERMLPALRHPQLPTSDVVRECQITGEQTKKSKLNEREKKQAALPIAVFDVELVEKFYSKHFADKEEGLRNLQQELQNFMAVTASQESGGKSMPPFSPNKLARATIFLLHRALRDKVYSVYSAAADVIRFFFHEFVPRRVSQAEVARSVEKLLPELMAKSGDATPRIHNMAAHTLLSMVDCKQVRDLHIIPAHLSRPISSSVHPRLALSRLEMVQQLVLTHGISTDKQSGLTCRTLAEFGSSGLHHPAEAVRKVSERILLQVYKVNPRLVRKQLPPDDDVTRRNLLYRQLFQELDLIDRRREQPGEKVAPPEKPSNLTVATKDLWHDTTKGSAQLAATADNKTIYQNVVQMQSQIPKRTVNQMTSPIQPLMPFTSQEKQPNDSQMRILTATKSQNNSILKNSQLNHETLMRRRNMSRISEEVSGALELEIKQPNHHFPNLVDSVHLTENRRTYGNEKKTREYIFPTSYIGNTAPRKPNSMVPDVKTNDAVCVEKPKARVSGIPVPKNGFKGRSKVATTLTATTKLAKPALNYINAKTWMQNNKNSDSMIMSVYIPDDNQLPAQQESAVVDAAASAHTGSAAEPCQQNEGQKFKACIFCLTNDDWFTEESLNVHYWKTCPMLTQCNKCNEVVEISGIIQHKLDDCEFKESFMKCDKCREAILKEDWDNHLCKKSIWPRPRCPLCHDDLSSEKDWRNHLMGNKLCVNHPRRPCQSNI